MTKQEASVSPLTDEEVSELRKVVTNLGAPPTTGPSVPNFPLAAQIEARELKTLFEEGVTKTWAAIWHLERDEDRKEVLALLEDAKTRFARAAEHNFYRRSEKTNNGIPTPAVHI